jgi:cephalosporin-C deacetylase-like acetyl esterase
VLSDPSYGYTPAMLRAVGAPPPPEDFAEFWAGLYQQARLVDPAPVARPSTVDSSRYDVEFTSVDGVRLGGWLCLPADERIERGLVVGHGYGGRAAPDAEVPVERAAVLYFCARGMPARGETVRAYARDHPEVRDVLRYFDAATAATFLRVPTHVGLALADPTVPPPGQFAVYNALAGPRERFLLTAGHTQYAGMAGEARALLAAQRDFLTTR